MGRLLKTEARHLIFAAVLLCLGGAGVAACASQSTDDSSVGGVDALTDTTPLAPGEPAYCLPTAFVAKEIQVPSSGLNRAQGFRLGNVTVVGLGVGDSKVSSVQQLALHYVPTMGSSRKSCTFYYNDGNDGAATAFNWYNLPKPIGTDYAGMLDTYSNVLANVFDTAENNFVSCASEQRYLAMGCDGMRHRGPTVFASMLAYSGCSPEHATTIVNGVWGENGIEPQMRITIATWAHALGASHPAQSANLRQLFLGQGPTDAGPSTNASDAAAD
jgi:hypothetical protein